MEKKWTTLRKVESPDQPGTDESGDDPVATPRTPRRRQLARKQQVVPEAEVVQAPPEPEKPVRPLEVSEPRILVVHDAASTYRLVEETFGNFTKAKVDSTSDVLNAFELAIRRDYQLFIIALSLPGMSGNLFYEMVSRGYATGLGNRKLAPAVVFVRGESDPLPSEDLIRDVRVKAVWTKPLNIERMLDSVSTVIERCDPAG
ncbi:MAG: response regulator [Verrucomicrobiales bacterium]|nr:response regulator [Verrucomicrobiales bacterium]